MAAALQRLLQATIEIIKLSLWKYILMPLEALFVTEKTLSSALDQLDANTMPLNNNDKIPDLEVTGMSDDQLTIQLSNTALPDKPHRTKKYSESSDDIEVVHSGELPNLHGILKGRARTASEGSDRSHQRTVSESSDEVFGGRGAYRREDSVSSMLSTGSASEGPSEGPVSESEEAHRKKSVSFSEYVDSTTYKANASVSTLHASLKKKSKRYRRKEAAKMERRRRRSSGSEHEHSSEEQSSQPDTSESVVEDDDSDVVIDHQQGAGVEEGGKLPPAPRADPHEEEEDSANVVAAKQSKKSKKNKKKANNKANKKGGVSEASAASHTPPETRGDSVTSEEGESCVEVVTPQHGGDRTKGGSGGAVNGVTGEKVGTEAAAGDDSDDTEQAASDRTKKQAPADTVLSWDNSKPESEDVTKCAFNFNNSMIYDLDDD